MKGKCLLEVHCTHQLKAAVLTARDMHKIKQSACMDGDALHVKCPSKTPRGSCHTRRSPHDHRGGRDWSGMAVAVS